MVCSPVQSGGYMRPQHAIITLRNEDPFDIVWRVRTRDQGFPMLLETAGYLAPKETFEVCKGSPKQGL